MGKLDIGVGDEFPVDEPPPPSQDTEEAVRAAREEWQRQKEDWRRRKHEWRAAAASLQGRHAHARPRLQGGRPQKLS